MTLPPTLTPTPAASRRKRREALLDRAVTYALVFVLVGTSAFAIWSSQVTSRSATLAIKASQLSDHYDSGLQAVAAEESLERKYRLEPGPDVLGRFRSAGANLAAAMERVRSEGTVEDRSITEGILAAHGRYVKAAERMFEAVDRRDTAEVERIDHDEADPSFDLIEQAVAKASAGHQEQAIRSLENLRARESFNVWSTPVVFLIGLGLVALFSGVLRRSRAERKQAEEASSAKSAFLAAMSHEIRTPMNGVIGMVEVLAQSRLNDDQADAVRTIRASGFSLLRIIDDILDFSKIEAGRLELEREPVELAELIEGVSNTLLPLAHGKNVDLSLFIGPRLPHQVWSDATRMRQVLYNLMGNAIKFSAGRPDREGRVSVRVDVVGDAPERLMLRIADNGIGMAPATISRLFTAFAQAEASTTRRFGGTGLGLAICKRLVILMGGEIDVHSALDEGSTFTVSLPLEAVADATRLYPTLAGLLCVVIGADRSAEDLALRDDQRVYLEHAGARVHMVPDLAAAKLVAMDHDKSVVILNTRRGVASDDPLDSAFRAARNPRHLLIARGPRSGAREPAPALVTLDGNCLRRSALLNAVAIAAGQTPPVVARADGAEDYLAERAAPPTVDEARDQGRLILIAEDDEINQKVVLRQMEILGYAAEVAGDGVEALKRWRAGRYGLLLSDLNMPEMDGYTLAATIRADEAAHDYIGRRIPILALTANAFRSEALQAQAAGMDEYLTKPLQLVQLGAMLVKWLPRPRGETLPGELRTELGATA
ncbi:MAG: ATP-binding protein [Caldimonas sp.]